MGGKLGEERMGWRQYMVRSAETRVHEQRSVSIDEAVASYESVSECVSAANEAG